MLIDDVIKNIKDYCGGTIFGSGEKIDDAISRDKITYGESNKECTGIITCIWPTADIIRQAQKSGVNLIISHEALFWNHGDHQDIISENKTFKEKKKLLDDWGGVVWRCHDYIHSRVPIDKDNRMVDGIFYGFAKKLGWESYRVGDISLALDYKIPETTGRELAGYLIRKLGLNGVRITGDSNAQVSRVHIPMHIMGDSSVDTNEILYADKNNVDCLITMEFVDFTTCEYIRDAGMLNQKKCAITVGHFNLEEPGMEYMAKWLPDVPGISNIPITFLPMTDTYQYLVR